LEYTLTQLSPNTVLVAHSLACTLVPHWAESTKLTIQGALLVAPPNPDAPSFPKEAVGFSPLPQKPLPFPSIVVASANDPYASLDFAKSAATAWRSHFVCIGAAGHINSQSGLKDWSEGFCLLKQLLSI
jgi:predicted alpha/beta hydrolase family esterase